MSAIPVSRTEPIGVGSVVHLLKAVVAVVRTPIDEDGSMIDTRAILAPSFKSHMGFGQGGNGRSLPSEIALDPIGAEDHGGATVAVAVTTGFMLPRIADIKDSDGSYEVELRSADIDVRAILNEPEGLVGGNKVVWGFWGAPNGFYSLIKADDFVRSEGLARSCTVRFEERFEDTVWTV
jgi:hypothetical protein